MVVAADVGELREHLFECAQVGDCVAATVLADAFSRPPVQFFDAEFRRSDADHRDIERAAPGHGVERREDLLARQVAGHAKQHQRVGMFVIAFGLVHLGVCLSSFVGGAS